MSCEEIQGVLDDWARGVPVDAAESTPALAHAETCPACGEFLEASRALSVALRAWREEDAGLEAPPRVEKALRAAFRGRARGPRLPLLVGFSTAAAAVLVGVLVIPRVFSGRTPASTPGPVAAEAAPVDPLYADPLEEGEAGEVVRVSLPASALHSMGFEVGDDAQGETVEADVLLGADGVARAVQVVE